jgi:hypothetical protein
MFRAWQPQFGLNKMKPNGEKKKLTGMKSRPAAM